MPVPRSQSAQRAVIHRGKSAVRRGAHFNKGSTARIARETLAIKLMKKNPRWSKSRAYATATAVLQGTARRRGS